MRRLFILPVLLLWSLQLWSASPALAAASETPAMVIEAGSVARDQVVALGRDLVIDGQALSDVAALNGQVRVSGEVVGDIIVLGGSVQLTANARVGGDVFVLGGSLETAPGAQLGGRSVAYPTASAAWLALLEAPALGVEPSSPILLGAKLALLTAWLALVLVFFAASGRQVLATSDGVSREPFRCFVIGFVGILAMVMTALLFGLLSVALVGFPLLVLVVLFALVLKLWGMVAVFHSLGGWLSGKLGRRRLTPLNCAVLGLLVLGAIKLLPWLGLWVWHTATFIGVGAALSTKLGRREPWFDLADLDSLPR